MAKKMKKVLSCLVVLIILMSTMPAISSNSASGTFELLRKDHYDIGPKHKYLDCGGNVNYFDISIKFWWEDSGIEKVRIDASTGESFESDPHPISRGEDAFILYADCGKITLNYIDCRSDSEGWHYKFSYLIEESDSEPSLSINVWTDKSEYKIGETVKIYYKTNKKCTAKLTVTKPDGEKVVIGGPNEIPACTRSKSPTAGYPTGKRTVVFEAWAGSEYKKATCYFDVEEEKKPDLIVSSINFNPNPANKYEDVIVSVTVKNRGKGDSGSHYEFLGYPDRYTILKEWYCSGLKAGASKTFTHTLKNVQHSDTYEACADWGQEVQESDDDNNCLTAFLEVKESEKKPNLVIESITPDITNPKKGDEIKFTVEIKNKGEGDADESFYIYYYIDGDKKDLNYVSGGLDKGKTKTTYFSWKADKCGKLQMKAWADATNAVTESDDGDNTKIKTLNVECPEPEPDLIITDVTSVYGYIGYQIKNQGTKAVSGKYTRWLYINDKEITSDSTYLLLTLDKGEEYKTAWSKARFSSLTDTTNVKVCIEHNGKKFCREEKWNIDYVNDRLKVGQSYLKAIGVKDIPNKLPLVGYPANEKRPAYYLASNVICIPANYTQFDHSILHEYGHYVEDKWYYRNIGKESVCNEDYNFCEKTGVKCAMKEGWAHFFSCLARDSSKFSEYFPLDLEKPFTYSGCSHLSKSQENEKNEIIVAAIFWDLYDPPNEVYDQIKIDPGELVELIKDSMNCPLLSVWTSKGLETCYNKGLETFYINFNDKYKGTELPSKFDTLLKDGYGIDYSNSIKGSLDSPANLHAYDSQGNHVGVNEQDEIELEIPNAYYTGPDLKPEEIIIFDQTEGITFKVEALDTGEFDFTVIQTTDTKTTTVTYLDVPVTETTEATVDVSKANPTYTMEIDNNGDGTTDYTKEPDSIETMRAESPVHNHNTGEDFATIQSAIDDPDTQNWHTITVDPGTYTEHLIIDKSLKVIGRDKSTTIIEGRRSEKCVIVTADNVEISGFTIQNSTYGIWLESSDGCTISRNIIQDNCDGIYLTDSNNNAITNNILFNNVWYFSGIHLSSSHDNEIRDNDLVENGRGVSLHDSNNNLIYHNNFVDGIFRQAYDNTGTNSWDNGPTAGGNYWSDHGCVGNPSAKPYHIDNDGVDLYPFQESGGWLKGNQPPVNPTLSPDKPEPQSTGTAITWTALATDPDGDTLYYRFWIRGPSTGDSWTIMQDWSIDNRWMWYTNSADVDDTDVSVWIRDGHHKPPDSYDLEKIYYDYQIASGTVGAISIASSPSGAIILLETPVGMFVGPTVKTPHTFTNVPVGTSTITLSLDGYQDWSTRVYVMAGETSNVHATLTPI